MKNNYALLFSIALMALFAMPSLAHANAPISLSPWLSTSAYPTNVLAQSCFVYGSSLYCMGGFNYSASTGSYSSSFVNPIYYTPILSTGALGSWQPTTSYPANVDWAPCTTVDGNVYCMGGQEGLGTAGYGPYNSVYYAPISSGGIGTWQPTTSYPLSVIELQCLPYNDYIYCVAGGTFGSTFNSVYYAQVQVSGGLGPWIPTTSYPIDIEDHSCVINGNDIYCVAGSDSTYTDAVYYAPISGTGGLGAWAPTTSYPIATAQESCTTADGYIFCMAGDTSNLGYYAQILSSGRLGPWASTGNYPLSADSESCASYSNSIYCVGGFNSIDLWSAPYSGYNSVYHATIVTPILLTPSSATIDNGQSATLSATASGGSGTGYVYTWYPGSSCTGTSLTSTTVSPTSNATYCVSATDSLSDMPMTGIETVAVNTAPEFTYTEWPSTNSAFNSPNEIILVLRIETSGTYPVTFTNLTGGATTTVTGQCPFTDNPYPYSAGVSGAGFTCYAIITPTNGVYTYTYAATIYGVTESANVVLTAGGNAPIAIASPTATSPVDAGQTISLSANGVSGGTGSYTTEQWYDAGTARENSTGTHVGPGNSLSATDTQPNTGVYYYYLVVSGGTDTAITPAISVTVDQAPTTTSVSCPAFTAGTPTTCTATVSGYNPTGTVSFTPGTATDSFSPASCTLAASGGSYTCQVSYTDTAAETPSITASYSGDTNNLASSSSASVTVLSYTAPTTTVSNGGGGGGGGGGPTGVSPTFVPTVTTSGNSCYVATPVAWLDTFTFHIGGTTISVLDNFISPNETGVQIGSQTYTLLENQPQSISGANATIELTNVSYLPIEHTVTLMLCPVSGASPLQPSLNSTTNSTTGNLTVQTSPVTTTVLPTIPTTSTVPAAVLTTTTVKPSGFGYLYYLLLAIVVVLLLLIFAYYRRRRKRDGKTN